MSEKWIIHRAGKAPKKPDPEPGPIRLIPSLFAHRKPTALVEYAKFLGVERPLRTQRVLRLPKGSKRGLTFKISISHEYNAVRNALIGAGFRRTQGKHFSLLWTKHLPEQELQALNPYQKVNHFPGTWAIGRKDRLANNVDRMKRVYGRTFAIAAPSFVLPQGRARLMAAMDNDPKALWIAKPPSGSCGRGIRLFTGSSNSSGVPAPRKKMVVQRYLKRPHLINGYKYDLRLYVLVTSFDPLRVYLFDDGLARFCTKKYSASGSSANLKARYGHLTNYSVNKKSSDFQKPQDAEDDNSGSKWSFRALLRHLAQQYGRDTALGTLARIKDVLIKTLLCCEAEVASACARCFRNHTDELSAGTPCFELLGMDVLLDSQLRPWIIEVNVSPSLSSSSPLDKAIKCRLLADTFHLVGFVPYDPQHLANMRAKRSLRRVQSGSASPRPPSSRGSSDGNSEGSRGGAQGRRRKGKAKRGGRVGFGASSPRQLGGRGSRGSSGRSSPAPATPVSSATTMTAPISGGLRHRTMADLEKLDVGELLPGELTVICETEDELARRGGFERIYPTTETARTGYYSRFFETPRFNNRLLELWLTRWKPRCEAEARRQAAAEAAAAAEEAEEEVTGLEAQPSILDMDDVTARALEGVRLTVGPDGDDDDVDDDDDDDDEDDNGDDDGHDDAGEASDGEEKDSDAADADADVDGDGDGDEEENHDDGFDDGSHVATGSSGRGGAVRSGSGWSLQGR